MLQFPLLPVDPRSLVEKNSRTNMPWKLTLVAPLAFLLLTACTRPPAAAPKKEAGPIQIQTAPVSQRDVERIIESVGTLFAYDESVISAEIDGRVDQVQVDLGDHVKPGQVMVHISDEEQRYLLTQNEAQLRQSLERLGLKNETDKVADVRDAPDPRRAQADLVDAEQRYKRQKSLVDQGIASQSDLDAAVARFKASQASYDATLYQTRNLVSEIERTKAVLDLQRKKLRDTSVRAPFDAFVKERTVTIGQFVRVNTPLITLVKIDPIRLRLEIPERLTPWVKPGQTVEVRLEAFENRSFQGKIWRISPTVEQAKRTFLVEALIANPAAQLKPGSYARARVPTGKSERIKLVPAKAVNYVFGSNKVYVVTAGTVEARDVKIGDRFDQDVEILSGVEQGEQVAVTQINRLDTGSKVRTVN